MELISSQFSNVVGVGIDLVEIDRIKMLYQKYNQSFIDKVFTGEEQSYCFSKKNPYPHLAVRFAAKEAVSKAFGSGIGQELDWKSVSVQVDSKGKPSILLDQKGQQLLLEQKSHNVLISLTHTSSMAQAMAIIVK